MFDIGFSELLLVFMIGLIVLGPQRLLVSIKIVAGWVRALRLFATTVQSELMHELKLKELQDSLKKIETTNIENLTPEFQAYINEVHKVIEFLKHSYTSYDFENFRNETNNIQNSILKYKEKEKEHEDLIVEDAIHQTTMSERVSYESNVKASVTANKTIAPISKAPPFTER